MVFGLVLGKWSLVEFIGFVVVRVVLHCFEKSGKEILAHSLLVSLALTAAIYEPYLIL